MQLTEPQVILQLSREEAKALIKGVNKNLANPNLTPPEKQLIQQVASRLNQDLQSLNH
jgi:hypothetical protein